MVKETDGHKERRKEIEKYRPYAELVESIFTRPPYDYHRFGGPSLMQIHRPLKEGNSNAPEVARINFYLKKISVDYPVAYNDARELAERWEKEFRESVELITHFKRENSDLSEKSENYEGSEGRRGSIRSKLYSLITGRRK